MGKKSLALLAAVLTTAGSAFAAEGDVVAGTITMPSGVDIGSLIQSGVLVLAGIVAIALAAWGSWLLVRKALQWVRKAF